MDCSRCIMDLCNNIAILENLPRWRFIKRKKTSNEITKLYIDFTDHTVWEQAAAIFTVLQHFNKNYPTEVKNCLIGTAILTPASLRMNFTKEEDGTLRDGYIEFTPKPEAFNVDVNDIENPSNTFAFTYYHGSNLNSSLREIWNEEILDYLDNKFYSIIYCIHDIIGVINYEKENNLKTNRNA